MQEHTFGHSQIMYLPHEIRRQEDEIESIFQNRIRRDRSARPPTSQDFHEETGEHYVAWIMIALLLFLSISSFCLLWLRASGSCGLY